MFSGIVDHKGQLVQVVKNPRSCRLGIETRFSNLQIGESLSIEGVCLTITDLSQGLFFCDVSSETLSLTTLSKFEMGQPVNLERALRMGDPIGGHWVTGHIDQIGEVIFTRLEENGFLRVQIGGIRYENKKYLIPKGSIAISGVSLTLNGLEGDTFEILLIPHTLERTTLTRLKVGSSVNLEFDWMTKVVLNQIENIQILRSQKDV